MEQNIQCILRAQEEMLSCGVLSVIEPDGLLDISPHQKVYNDDKLDQRVTCFSGSYGWGDTESLKTKLAKYGFNNIGDDHLR